MRFWQIPHGRLYLDKNAEMRCHHVFLGRNEQDDFSGLQKLEEAMKPAANKLQIFVPQEHNAAISKIQDQILTIRGTQVILDRDLAELYGVSTSALYQAAKRNINRFPERLMYQLSDDEFRKWKSPFVISNLPEAAIRMELRKRPFVFFNTAFKQPAIGNNGFHDLRASADGMEMS